MAKGYIVSIHTKIIDEEKFESVEAAKAFYACEDYQGAKMKLDGKVDRVMFIIEGV